MYSRESTAVTPRLYTPPRRSVQSLLTDPDRLASSPALYLRKKVAGRLMSLAIIAASMGTATLVWMRAIASSREAVMS